MQQESKQGIYSRYIKRILDVICALLFLLLFWWVLAVLALLVRCRLGRPVIFKQPRPGKGEKIFTLYKFRTMTDARGADGELLPDEDRLTHFGKKLRATSLDELPEIFNILDGTLSCVGPRPLLVKDMVFMTEEQRTRHSVRQGLTGLAQVNGRNCITWENKFKYDLQYIQSITFFGDLKIILKTIGNVLRREGINDEGMATAEDLGDYLLRNGKISPEDYRSGQAEARNLTRVQEEAGAIG